MYFDIRTMYSKFIIVWILCLNCVICTYCSRIEYHRMVGCLVHGGPIRGRMNQHGIIDVFFKDYSRIVSGGQFVAGWLLIRLYQWLRLTMASWQILLMIKPATLVPNFKIFSTAVLFSPSFWSLVAVEKTKFGSCRSCEWWFSWSQVRQILRLSFTAWLSYLGLGVNEAT